MAGIPDDKIAEVRSRADIVRVVGRSVNLKKAGRSWKGLCPFHQEKTPSFHVVPDKQIFHCFGCQAGGDVFRFVMDLEGRNFPEAVRMLAEEYGVEIPETDAVDDARARARREESKRLREVNAQAAALFERWLWEDALGAPGRAHLVERGIDEEAARRFGLGYAPLRNDLGARLAAAGIAEQDLRATGLLVRGDRGVYERFRGRLMVPIREPDGRVIAFGARIVEGDHPAKYLNSPESPVYHKSSTLFGLDLARTAIRQTDCAVVVEGYFDVIALSQAGVENAVATCGTALTEAHCRLLSRHARDIHLVFDGDEAGAAAVTRAHEVVAGVPSLLTRVVALPSGHDPDTLVRERGAAGFAALQDAAVPATEFLVDRALASVGPSVEERVRAVDGVRPLLVQVKDDLTRRLYVTRVAERLGMEERTLVAHLRAARTQSEPAAHHEPPPPPVEPLPPPPAAEQALCLLVMDHPGLAPEIEPHIGELTHPAVRALLTELLAATASGAEPDVGALMEQVTDPELRRQWLAHHAGLSSRDQGPMEDQEAARWASVHLRRIQLASLDRRERAMRQQHSRAGTDPVAAARELSELKAERRRLQQRGPRRSPE